MQYFESEHFLFKLKYFQLEHFLMDVEYLLLLEKLS